MDNAKKKTILKSAESLFAKRGFNETTVADIAKECVMREASIYSYFASKKDILFAIYGGYLQDAIQTLKGHFLGMKEPGAKLRKSIWHYLAHMKDNPNYARILMMAQRESPEFYESSHFKYLKEYAAIVLGVVTRGQEEGFFRKDISARLIRNLAMGASVFTVIDSIVHHHPYDPHQHSDLIYQLVHNATVESGVTVETNEERPGESKAEARKTQILTNSTHVFSKRGFSAATISQIAKATSLSDSTLYEYFEGKADILLAIPETHFKDILSDKNLMCIGRTKIERRLQKLIWRWIWLLWTREEFSRILFLELFRNSSFYSTQGYLSLTLFLEKIQEIVQRGQEEEVFLKDIPYRTYLNMILGTIDQYMLSQFLLSRRPPGISELNSIVDALVRAILIPK